MSKSQNNNKKVTGFYEATTGICATPKKYLILIPSSRQVCK